MGLNFDTGTFTLTRAVVLHTLRRGFHCSYFSSRSLKNTHVLAEKAYPQRRLSAMSASTPAKIRADTGPWGQIIGIKTRHPTVAKRSVPSRTYLALVIKNVGLAMCKRCVGQPRDPCSGSVVRITHALSARPRLLY